MVAEEGEHRNNARGADVQRQFVFEDGELLDVFGEALKEVGAVGVEFFGRFGVFGDGWVGRGSLGEGRLRR